MSTYTWEQRPERGQRVVALRDFEGKAITGLHGTIVQVDDGSDLVSVSFDDWTNGHSSPLRRATALEFNNGSIWNIDSHYLHPVEGSGGLNFYLVRIVDKVVTPIPNERRYATGEQAAHRAKELTRLLGYKVQPRRIDQDAGSDVWRERERSLIESGRHKPLPKGWDLAPIPDHFAHLDPNDQTMIRYTDSPESGVTQRRISTTPGRYLERFYKDLGLSDKKRKSYIALIDKAEDITFVTSPAEVVRVYLEGPSSCMTKPKSSYASCVHPVQVYAEGDLAVAYIKNKTGSISARCIVWPEKKIYGRIYGDEPRMAKVLQDNGFARDGDRNGTFAGAKMKKLFDKNQKAYVMAYFDGTYYGEDLNPDATDGFIALRPGAMPTAKGPAAILPVQTTGGIVQQLRWCPKLSQYQDGPSFVLVNGESEKWSLAAARAHACEITDRKTGEKAYYDKSLCVMVGGTYYLKADMAGKIFQSAYSLRDFHVDERHDLGDGRFVSKREWKAEGYVCSGSGRPCMTYHEAFGGNTYFTRSGRIYSHDYLELVASENGIKARDMIDHIVDGKTIEEAVAAVKPKSGSAARAA